MEDKLLVIMCKNGSKKALGRIYDKYRDYLLITAIALSNNTKDAEDAVHDVFVSFVEKISDFKLTGNLRSYLAVCLANRIRNILSSKRPNPGIGDEAINLASSDSPPNNLISNERLEQLSGALSMLPVEQREVIVMHVYGGMSLRAIAYSQKESVNTTKSRYRYGIEKLRTFLECKVQK